MALLVVALLTISVVEFFYSAEVDSRMARNSIHSLQASLLARSGIALGEALLLKDQDPMVDSFLEEWCPAIGREGRACQIEDGGGLVVIPEGMRLRVEIWDEGGKININFTRPRDANQWRAVRNNPNPDARTQPFQWWVDALGRLFESRGIAPETADALEEYWDKYFEQLFPQGSAGATPGMTPSPGAASLQTPGSYTPALPLFNSLDDLTRVTGMLSSAGLRQIRPFVTAGPFLRAQVNVNTASREVLNAIIGDGESVENLITQRQSEPITAQTLASYVNPAQQQDQSFKNARLMLTSVSDLYLIRASAIVNTNPITGLGGISRSAEMVVRRTRRVQPGVGGVSSPAGGNPANAIHWTLTRLYWQKEGGAVLFRPEMDSTTGESVDSSLPMY